MGLVRDKYSYHGVIGHNGHLGIMEGRNGNA